MTHVVVAAIRISRQIRCGELKKFGAGFALHYSRGWMLIVERPSEVYFLTAKKADVSKEASRLCV
jgi:hypothetical protein